MKPRDIKAGKTMYYAHVLNDCSYVTKMVAKERPKAYRSKTKYGVDLNGELFVKVKEYSDILDEWIESEISLRDANVVPNTYNKHRLFFSRRRAETYARMNK